MNDQSPESALAECMALSEKATPSPWIIYHEGETYSDIDTDDGNWVADGVRNRDSHFIAAAVNLIRTHGAHFAALAGDAEFVRSGLRSRGEYIEGQPPLPLALVAYDHMKLRAERAEAERDAAVRDAELFGWMVSNHAVLTTNGYGDWRVEFGYTSPVSYGPWADNERAAIDAAMSDNGEG